MEEKRKSNATKLAVVIIMLIAAGAYALFKARSLKPAPSINNGVASDFQEMPTTEEQQKLFQQATVAAEMTPDQLKQIDEARKIDWTNPDQRQQALDKMDKVMSQLSDDQKQKMRDTMRSGQASRQAKMKAALGDDEYKRYQERRREQWAGRGPRGGGAGGGRPRGNGGSGTPQGASPAPAGTRTASA